MAARFLIFGMALLAVSTAGGCQEEQQPPSLSSLRRSGQVTFLCLGADGQGAPLTDCPRGSDLDFGGLVVGKPGHELYALVTQTVSAEVAVVRVTGADDDGDSTAEVVDLDPSNPGVTPLRVGLQPGDIVSTLGGHASFVGVGEVGKEGIFALPTSCIQPPRPGETARDLTTWPACSLPSAPGAMVVVVDPTDDAGRVRASCDGEYLEELPAPGAAGRPQCAADLREEVTVQGRQKLYVALPEEGRIVVLDAQALLDRTPGSFSSCLDPAADAAVPVFQGSLPLEVDLPSQIVQPLPADLVKEGCTEPRAVYGPFPGPFEPRPGGMAARDGSLLVADRGAPVVHRVDITDPCAPQELAPLIATSFEQPARIVTTSDVALSPLTTSGERYAYAIDELGRDLASLMVFDLSPGAVSRTPLVRPRSPEMPLEPPDRIEFNAPVKDVEFALFDQPIPDPVTGSAALGTQCDPDPNLSVDAPEARYRPSPDFEIGAKPSVLRGLFGYVLLGDGTLGLVDVEDFDAACRRPASTNPLPTPDFRGCGSDPIDVDFYTDDGSPSGTPTVTDEVSCQVVQRHRARSARLLIRGDVEAVDATEAPALSTFGRLGRRGRGLPVSRLTAEGKRRPIMLGVDFDSPSPSRTEPAQVYVGNVLRKRTDQENPLVINPNEAEQISMTLPFVQPRAYPLEETVVATYEGSIAGELPSGRLALASADPETGALTPNEQPLFLDSQAANCDFGVRDVDATEEYGARQFSLSGSQVTEFGRRHADYVQITSDVLSEDDPYWDTDQGQQCGLSENAGVRGYDFCDARFGDGEADEVLPERDLRILRAYQHRLVVEPRATGQDSGRLLAQLQCCFPQVVSYRLRTSRQWTVVGSVTGFSDAVTTQAVNEGGEELFRCVPDCNPLKSRRAGRAFELSNSSCENDDPEVPESCGVGSSTPDDLVCVYDSSGGPVRPGGAASECIFDGLTRRFAIYRGLEPSRRDMAFSLTVLGGFVNQRVLIGGGQGNVLPVAMEVVPSFLGLGVVDSQNRGLVMIDLRRPQVLDEFF